KVRRLRAAQNAIDIGGGTTPVLYPVVSVGEQTAVSGKVRYPIGHRYVVSGRRQYDRHAMNVHEYVRHDDKAAEVLPPKVDDGRFNLHMAMDGPNDWHDLE